MSQTGTRCRASTSSRRAPYGAPEAPVSARTTGWSVIARAGWESGRARGAGEQAGAPVAVACDRAAEAPAAVAVRLPDHPGRPDAACSSKHPVDQGEPEHRDAHNPVHREERGVEPGEVTRADQAVLVDENARRDEQPHEVPGAEVRPQTEQRQGRNGEPV